MPGSTFQAVPGHPRDLDTGQPRLEGLPLTRKFKSYVGLHGAKEKLRRYLSDFRFMDIETAAGVIDWGRVRVVRNPGENKSYPFL